MSNSPCCLMNSHPSFWRRSCGRWLLLLWCQRILSKLGSTKLLQHPLESLAHNFLVVLTPCNLIASAMQKPLGTNCRNLVIADVHVLEETVEIFISMRQQEILRHHFESRSFLGFHQFRQLIPGLIPEDGLQRRKINAAFGKSVIKSIKCLMDGEDTSKSLSGNSKAFKAPGGIGPTQTCSGSSRRKRLLVASMALSRWRSSGAIHTMTAWRMRKQTNSGARRPWLEIQ